MTDALRMTKMLHEPKLTPMIAKSTRLANLNKTSRTAAAYVAAQWHTLSSRCRRLAIARLIDVVSVRLHLMTLRCARVRVED